MPTRRLRERRCAGTPRGRRSSCTLDANGEIIGAPIEPRGVIHCPFRSLGLCAGLTDARFTSATEVDPDSPRFTPEGCNAGQVAAVRAALEHALASSSA